MIEYLSPQYLIWDRLGEVGKGREVLLQNGGSGQRFETLECLVPPSTTVSAPVNKILLLGGRSVGLLV